MQIVARIRKEAAKNQRMHVMPIIVMPFIEIRYVSYQMAIEVIHECITVASLIANWQ